MHEPETPPPPLSRRRKPGRSTRYIGKRQRAEFLGALALGKGRDRALIELGISARTFRNTYDKHPAFRLAVQSATRAAHQDLEWVARNRAMEGDSEILFKLLDRRDRAEMLLAAPREKARDRDLAAHLAALGPGSNPGRPRSTRASTG